MKIVQINATYGFGSTGHIVEDIHHYLQETHEESYVFWGSRCTDEGKADPHVIRVGNDVDHKIHALLRRIKNNQGWNSLHATKKMCKSIETISPDIVHLHNLHSNYINIPYLLKFLANAHIAVVVTLHDCWLFTGHCMHFLNYNCRNWKKNACAKCPAVHPKHVFQVQRQYQSKRQLFSQIVPLGIIGVSDWILSCSNVSLLGNASLQKRIYNWIDTSAFFPQNCGQSVREKYNLARDKAIVLGVSQGWSENKGLLEFRKIAEQLEEQAEVVLVGESNGNVSEGNVKFIGFTNSVEELAELYSAADVFVNPSRMETFGKVTAEALACGTPVVAYANTGTAELFTKDEGILVSDGDVNSLIAGVRGILQAGKDVYTSKCRRRAENTFEKELLLSQYRRFYEDLLRQG